MGAAYSYRTGYDTNGDLIFSDRPDGAGRFTLRDAPRFAIGADPVLPHADRHAEDARHQGRLDHHVQVRLIMQSIVGIDIRSSLEAACRRAGGSQARSSCGK